MSINPDSTPEFMNEDKGLNAPFGKRIYDKNVINTFKGIKKFKFFSVFLLLLSVWILIEVLPSKRVDKFTAKSIEFDEVTHVITKNGEKFKVPSLVMEFQTKVKTPSWTKMKVSPIKVLSFVGATEIPPGAEAKAVLLTGATNGLIKARLTEPLKVDGVSLLDAGVLLIGQGRSTEERLFVDFKKAVFKNGKSIAISAQAYDQSDTILGLKGSRVGDATLKLAASSGLFFLSGLSSGFQSSGYDINGRPIRPSMKDAALNGTSQAASEQARSYMEDIKNRAPIIEVKSGTAFVVTFDGGD